MAVNIFNRVFGETDIKGIGLPQLLPNQTFFGDCRTINNTSDTQFFGADVFITTIIFTNSTAAALNVLVRDTTGANTYMSVEVPANTTVSIGSGIPIMFLTGINYNTAGAVTISTLGFSV